MTYVNEFIHTLKTHRYANGGGSMIYLPVSTLIDKYDRLESNEMYDLLVESKHNGYQ